jgi:hypothetical protein
MFFSFVTFVHSFIMANIAPGELSLGGDPRVKGGEQEVTDNDTSEQTFVAKPNFAVYLYLAAIQRRREGVKITNTFSSNISEKNEGTFEKDAEDASIKDGYHPVTGWNIAADKAEAHRALRVASWMSVFYLITTDILGPTSCPWAFAQLGYVPGVLLYLFMGLAAAYTGWQIWIMYLALDSVQFPLRTYSDLAGRIFGKTAEHIVNVLQSIQLLFNVAVIILGNGQGLSQVAANANVCFSVLVLVWALAGMFVGQIRSLKNFGWLANSAIWMNLIVIFITMVCGLGMLPWQYAVFHLPLLTCFRLLGRRCSLCS